MNKKLLAMTASLVTLLAGMALFGTLALRQPQKPAVDLIAFAESFLPASANGSFTRQDKEIIYKEIASGAVRPRNDGSRYEAVFKDDSIDIWIKREDSAFGLGMKAVLSRPVTSQIKNNRVIYNAGSSALIYTPQTSGVREDIVVAGARDLERLALKWQLGLDKNTQARLEKDGSVGIYGPEQFLWGNIQIGDAKSAQLIEQARKNAPKTQLLYKIPLPVVRDFKGIEHKAIAQFILNGNSLSLKIKGYRSLAYPISIDPTVTITSTSDFQAGNNEGMVVSGTNKITRAQQAGGTISAWANTTAFTTARRDQTTAAYNGYLYLLGGRDGASNFNDVQYAPINANGTLGAWSTTSSFTTGRYGHTSVAYNSYLYVLGGYNDTSSYCDDVQYALINSDGTLGAWSTTTVFTTTRYGHTSAAYNGYLYVLGGEDSSGYLSDTQYAPINASGTLGSWSATSSFTTARYGHTTVAYNGYLYILGGYYSASAQLNDVQYSPINSDGTLGAWSTTSSFTTVRGYHTSAAYNGYLYLLGGRYASGSSNQNDVQCAPINANGTLGAWSTTSAFTTARYAHTSVAYNGYLYLLGGYTTTYAADVQYAAISTLFKGSVGAWSTTTSFTTVRSSHATVVYNGYLYVLGGYNAGSTYYNDVQYAPINSNGTLGAWSTTSAFTTARYGHTAATYNGYLYVSGGYSNGSFYSSVQYAPINSNGTVGTWSTTSAFTTARYYHATATYNGYMYILGGSGYNDVQYAPINSDGTLGAWSTTSSFTTGRKQHTSVAYNGYLYVIGGYTNASAADVQYAPINSDGSVGAWSTTTSFTNRRYSHTSVAYNGYLYVLGGYDGNSYTKYNTVQSAPINPDGSVGAWATTTAFTTARYTHTSAFYNGYLYVLGGYDGSCYNDVQYAPINSSLPASSGTLGSWATTTAFTTARYGHASVAYNGYLYILGGEDSSGYLSDAQYVAINSNGTLGAWSTTSAFTTARYGHASVAYNGYLYILGGNSLSDVQYAPVNSDGTLGAWSTTSSFTTGRKQHTSVAYNGYLYLLGGTDGTNNFSDAQYVAINSNGTLGSWATTSSFITATSQHGSVAYNGYIYVLGGYNAAGTDNLSDVQYAPINANGTIGAWATTSSFTTARRYLAPVAYNGYMYILGGYSSADLNDIQYALINSDGTLGSWATTTAFTTARYGHASVAYNGYLYVLGGKDSSGYLSDTQYAVINTPAQKGYYSKLIDLGGNFTANSITINGSTLSGTVGLQYRLALESDGVFGAATTVSPVTLGSAVTIGANGRYLFARLALDDTYSAVLSSSATNERDVTDFTVDCISLQPIAPTNCLISTPAASGQLVVTWTDNSSNEEGFHIYRSTDGTNFPSQLTSAAANAITITDTSLSANTQYWYKVSAYSTLGGDSDFAVSTGKYTLPETPAATCDKAASTSNYALNTTFTFTNNAGGDATFGDGHLAHYHYLWDNTAAQTKAAVEASALTWSSSTLALVGSAGGDWYLHLVAQNGDGLANSAVADLGPYKIDTTAPGTTVNITSASYSPVTWDAANTISGAATDSGSGVALVEVAINDGTDHYWNGSNWSSTSIAWNAVTSGTTSWTYTLAAANLSIGKTYTVQARGTDAAGNLQSSGFGSDSFTYTPGPAASLAFTTDPSTTASAGTAFTIQPVVTLYDAYNNICTNDSATVVTLFAVLAADGVTPATGTLANATKTAASGVATFSAVSYSKSENIKLIATTQPTLASNVDKYLIVRDTAGKKISGWIKAAGTGETYGSELLSNPSFDVNTTGWIIENATAASITGGYSNNCAELTATSSTLQDMYATASIAVGKLYKTSAYVKNGSLSNQSGQIVLALDGIGRKSFNTSVVWQQILGYGTGKTARSDLFFLQKQTADLGTILFDEASVKQVLTPASSGAIIVNSSGGTTYNWIKDSGFAANNSSGYTYELYNTAPTPAASGTVTQANMRISSVNGTAFVDFSSGTDLTANTGKYLIIRDSAGKALKGWIKAAGTGEMLGSELWLNGDFVAWTGGNPDNWTVRNETPPNYEVTQVASTEGHGGVGTGACNYYSLTTSPELYMQQGSGVVGQLYVVSVTLSHVVSGVLRCHTGSQDAGAVLSAGDNNLYRTMIGSIGYIGFIRGSSNVDLTIDNASLKQVLTPSSTGATIVSDANSQTYNWTIQDSGFNPNDASGYTYEIYSAPPVQLSGTVTLANAKLSLVDGGSTASGGAFADFGGVPQSSPSGAITMSSNAASAAYTLNSPADITAGARAAYTVTRYDAYGNLAITGAETVYLYSNSTGTYHFYDAESAGNIITSVTIANGASSANFWYYDTLVGGPYTLTASDNAASPDAATGKVDATDSISVAGPASAATLSVSGITASLTAGASSDVVVTAKDAFNNTVTGYTGTVNFTSTDAQAALPANYTFVAGDLGTHTFTAGVSLKTAGSQSVTATDTVTGAITGAQTGITVSPAAVASLSFTNAALSAATAGSSFSPQPQVTLYDAYGNICTNDSATAVTLSAVLDADGITAGTGTLAGTLTQTAASGVVNFTGVSYSKTEAIKLVASTDRPTIGSNVGQYLVVRDSAGKSATGWIKSKGTGETYADIINGVTNNGNMESNSNWAQTAALLIFEQSNAYVHTGTYSWKWRVDTIGRGIRNTAFTSITGSLYKASQWIYHTAGGLGYETQIRNGADSAFILDVTRGSTDLAWINSVDYYTETAGGAGAYFSVVNGSAGTKEFYSDDVSLKQVLSPATTGAIIVSAANGSTQNWASKDTGFNPNSTNGLTYFFYNPVPSATGSVTQANMKLSLVNGNTTAPGGAFVDFSSGTALTANTGKYLVIKDSSGNKLEGWIKAAGTGETLGSDILGGIGAFNDATGWNLPLAPWTITGGQLVGAFTIESRASFRTTASPILANVLYKVVADVYTSGGYNAFLAIGNYVTYRYPTYTGLTTYTNYGVSTVNSTFGFDSGSYRFAGTIDNVTCKQVLTPSTTGATIVSSKNGVNYNWLSQGSNFNPNDSSGYTYEIYDSAPPVSGSLTQANTRISAVAGAAFVDFNAAGSLTNAIGKYLVIKDSAGKKLSGYIKAAGTGETYSAELVTNGNMETGSPPSNWTGSGATVASVADQATGGSGSQSISVTSTAAYGTANSAVIATNATNKLFKITGSARMVTSAATFVLGSSGWGQGTSSTSWTSLTSYLTSSVASPAVQLMVSSGAIGQEARFDDVSAKQVLTPSSTGVTIVSTPGGAVQNWASQDSGFSPNSATFTYELYDTALTAGTAAQANAKLSLVDGTAFADFGGADIGKSAAITMSPGAVSFLAFDTQPAGTAQAGVAFSPQPVVKLYDANGNLCTNNSSTQVTLYPVLASDGTTPGTGILTNATVTASSGIATFSGVSYSKNESIKLLAQTAPGLTSNIGKYLIVKDSAGKMLKGWIKAAGTGETLGSELVNNGAFASDTNWTKGTGWTISGGTAVADGTGSNVYIVNNNSAALSIGAFYYGACDAVLTSGWATLAPTGGYPNDYYRFFATGSYSKYTTKTAAGGTALLSWSSPFQFIGTVDNVSVKQVLTPSLSGATIVSTQAGSTYNWASQDSGFSPNSASAYTAEFYANAPIASGTVTQANMKLSLVSGGANPSGAAFVDFSSGTDLTANIGKYIAIRDSAGKTVTGYIKEAGSGETYLEKVVNGDMELNSDWSDYQTPTTNERSNVRAYSGIYSRHIVGDAANDGIYQLMSVIGGGLYKYSFWGYNVSGASQAARDNLELNINPSQFITGSWSNRSGYRVCTASLAYWTLKAVCLDVATEFYVDDLSVKQVLTPSTTGATIVNSPAGTIYNWASQDSAFNPNDASGYTYQIYDNQPTLSGTITPSIAKLSLVDGTAFADFGGAASVNSTQVTMAPATAVSMVFDTQPSSTAIAGTNFTAQPVIKLYDSRGNLCSNDTTTQVTLSAVLASDGATAGSGALNGTKTATAVNGVVTFSGLNYTVAEDIKLKAGSGALFSVNSNTIAMSPIPLILTSPDPATSQTFKAGASVTINWTSLAAFCPYAVNIKYSTDSGATYPNTIASAVYNAAGSNSYAWTVPSSLTTQLRIKIEDTYNAQDFDTSDADLSIAYPAITIISPNGGESWSAGSTHNITWATDSPGIVAVKLEYSTDGGSTWNVITASCPNTGSYSWTMSNLFVTGQLKVRATGLAGIPSLNLTLSGTAASKVASYAKLEAGNKTLVLDVLSDFVAGDTLVVSGPKFSNFSASSVDYLGLDIYNGGLKYVSDDKTISVSVTGNAYVGGSGDGWSYAVRTAAVF